MKTMTNSVQNLMSFVFATIMSLVLGFSFTSCENEEFNEELFRTQSVTEKEVPTPDTPAGEIWWLKRDSVNNGHSYEFEITAGDSTSGQTAVSYGMASMDENDKYTIEEKYRNLDLDYANSHKTLGTPECSMSNGSMNVVTLATFNLEDGNVVKVNSKIAHAMGKIEGVNRFFPCDSLTDVKLISVKNVEKPAMTRAAAQYVSDSVYTEIKAELTYVTTGLEQNYAYTQVLGDTITRYILSDNDVETVYAENKQRTILSSTTEQCSFDKVVKFKNGEVSKLSKSIVLQYGIQTIPEYEKIVTSFNYALLQSNGIATGDVKMNRLEENWTVNRRVDTYSALFTNPAEDIVSDYTLFHEGAVYQDENITVEFPVLDMIVSEANTSVSNISGDGFYEMARLSNMINVSYLNNSQNATETVLLKKEAKRVVSEGWDASSAKKTISLWSVETSIDYVVVYSDNTEDRTNYTNSWSWNFGPNSSWDVTADNNSYYTGNVNAAVTAASKEQTKGDVKYAWNENTHVLAATVTVANGNQTDKWNGKTINDITITRNEHAYNFGHDDYSLTDGKGKLGNATETDTESVYPYTHSVEFGFGGVKTSAKVDGKIRVAKVADPAYFPAKVLNITTIVCNNSARDGYMYSGLAHLEGGMVVPFSYDKTNLVWHLNDAVNTTSTKLNGAVYERSSGSWIPVYAYDSPDMLEYVSESHHSVDSQSYPNAIKMNWDEGHKVNGHASVTTSRLSFTVGNGVVSATDTYTGASLGSWTY